MRERTGIVSINGHMSNCLLKAWTRRVVLILVRSFSPQQVINRLTQDSCLVSALRMGEQVLHSDSSSPSTSLSEAQGASQKRGRKCKSQRVGGRAMKHCLLDGTRGTGHGGRDTVVHASPHSSITNSSRSNQSFTRMREELPKPHS